MENTENMSEVSMDSAGKKGMTVANKILIVLIVVAAVSGVFFYNKTRVLQQDPNKVNEAKIMALVEKVNKIIDLPKGETPVMATVSDLAPLAGNPFFAKAKVGDEVLLYPVARQAYLYNPGDNIIVEVASLNIGQ
ncbi:MAG: hypothetical protein ABL899_02150 [Nitrospira sp.]